MRGGTCSALATLVVVLAAGDARAEPSDRAQAETLFRQGRELLAAGKIAEACEAFDTSQRLDPTISTVMNQANCREKNGQLATAWGEFLEAVRLTRTATDAHSKPLHDAAADRAARLEGRISKLTISVPDASKVDGLEIRRDREVVEPGRWNRALPVDGGTYHITARAPGSQEWSTTIVVASERDTRSVDVPRLEPAPVPRPTVSARPVPPARSRTAPIAIAGIGVAALGGAVGFELWARSIYDTARAAPDQPTADARWRSANTRRYVAEGMLAGGVACAGVAVYLLVRGGERESATALVPTLGSDHAGLALAGRY
jgi:hypothetical protein